MSRGNCEGHVIDDSNVDDNPWLGGVCSRAGRDQGTGGCCLRAAGRFLMRNGSIGRSRADRSSGVRQGGVGARHIGLGLI